MPSRAALLRENRELKKLEKECEELKKKLEEMDKKWPHQQQGK